MFQFNLTLLPSNSGGYDTAGKIWREKGRGKETEGKRKKESVAANESKTEGKIQMKRGRGKEADGKRQLERDIRKETDTEESGRGKNTETEGRKVSWRTSAILRERLRRK
jgi:hypothetical protein